MTIGNSLPDNLTAQSPHSPTDRHEREQTWFIINRAYQNIYGMNLAADPGYQQIIFDAALNLRRDPRSANLDEKSLLNAVEDIIRISDEHHRLANKHMSRASNPVYLRETAIDNIIEKQKYLQAVGEIIPNSEVTAGCQLDGCTELDGRVRRLERRKPSSSEIMELAYQQLALNSSKR